MKLTFYNQTLDKYSSMGCIEYGIAHIFLLDYYIQVLNNFLLNMLRLAEIATIWSPKQGAAFDKMYTWNKNLIASKLGLEFDIKVVDVTKLQDGTSYGLGIKKFNTDVISIFADGIISDTEIKQFIKSTKGVGHHLVWKNNYLIDSYTAKAIFCTREQLQQLINIGAIWNTFRTFVPSGDFTIKVCQWLKRFGEAEKPGFLKQYFATNDGPNLNNQYYNKAKEIYFFKREDKNEYIK